MRLHEVNVAMLLFLVPSISGCGDPLATNRSPSAKTQAKGPVSDAEVPEPLLKAFRRAERFRDKLIVSQRQSLADAELRLSNAQGGWAFYSPTRGWFSGGTREYFLADIPDLVDQTTAIAQAEKEVKSATRLLNETVEKRNFIPPFIESFSDGEIGIVGKGTIQQIVADDEAIVEFGSTTAWVEGINFSRLADGDQIELKSKMMEVDGTKRYKTVLGAPRTLIRLKPYIHSAEAFDVMKRGRRPSP